MFNKKRSIVRQTLHANKYKLFHCEDSDFTFISIPSPLANAGILKNLLNCCDSSVINGVNVTCAREVENARLRRGVRFWMRSNFSFRRASAVEQSS